MTVDLPPPTPSHVIVIQADDLGVDDLYFSGNALAYTPHLDRLAKESVRATDFTVSSVCSVSRATLMTGRHFLRTGVSHVQGGRDFLHLNEKTIADAFVFSDWDTAIWGKWHLGKEPGYYPWERGFQEAYMVRGYKHASGIGMYNGELVEPNAWADVVIVDYAIDFLQRNPEGPSFMYLSSISPHAPLRAPEHWIQFHRDRGAPEALATLNAMVSHLDEQLGRLFDALESSGAMDNTLIIFTSDNGPAVNQGIVSDEGLRLRKVGGRRGWKGDLWENGVRAPLLIHWPARLEPGVITVPMDQVDLLPTLLDWCGVEWPSEYPELDGQSRRALVEGDHMQDELEFNVPTTFNYAHAGWITSDRLWTPTGLPGEYNPVSVASVRDRGWSEHSISIREGRFKWLQNPFPPDAAQANKGVLVDLYKDPGETTDVSHQHPEVALDMKSRLEAWFTDVTSEPHAFTSPVITVPADDERLIRACLVSDVRGALHNTLWDVRGWGSAGDTVDYTLDVARGGRYAVSLHWTEAPRSDMHFRASATGIHTSGHTNGSLETSLGELPLQQGANTLSVSRLSAGLADDSFILEAVELSICEDASSLVSIQNP